MKKIFLFPLLFLSLNSFCQKLTCKDFRGTWVVVDNSDTSKQNYSYTFTFEDVNFNCMINGELSPTEYCKIDEKTNLAFINWIKNNDTLHYLFKYIDKNTLKWQSSKSPHITSTWKAENSTNTKLLKRFRDNL